MAKNSGAGPLSGGNSSMGSGGATKPANSGSTGGGSPTGQSPTGGKK